MYLVARDGSPFWQASRAGATVAVTMGVVLLLTRASGRLRAAVAFATGLVVTPAGIGVGAAHLVKGGSWPGMVTGLLILLSGVTLLMAGSVALVLGARGWRRAPTALVVGALGLLLVTPTWPAFYATNVPRPALGPRTPADFGLPYEDARFRASDGPVLAGWYVPSRNGAAVVLLHGASSTRTSTLPQAAVLARHGYGVLLYDARGHGESTGRAMEFGWYGDHDLAGAVTFLQRRPDVDGARIAALGLSMGAEQAIGAAAADPRIKAVVAEGATGRTAADLDWLSDEYGVRGSLTESWQGLLLYGLTDLLTAAGPPISLREAVVQAAPRPVLLITAGRITDERAAGRHIRSGSPSTVAVWNVADSDHTDGLSTAPVAWRQRVLGFLDSALRAGG